MAVRAELLSIEVAFVNAAESSVEANRAYFLEGCAGFPSKKKKKKRAISLPEEGNITSGSDIAQKKVLCRAIQTSFSGF